MDERIKSVYVQVPRQLVEAIVIALRAKRNRFGKIEYDGAMAALMMQAIEPVRHQLPHGGLDLADQAQMSLTAILGEPVRSVVDIHK
jgi:hypothetical protein